jgi:hypothetical protein
MNVVTRTNEDSTIVSELLVTTILHASMHGHVSVLAWSRMMSVSALQHVWHLYYEFDCYAHHIDIVQ